MHLQVKFTFAQRFETYRNVKPWEELSGLRTLNSLHKVQPGDLVSEDGVAFREMSLCLKILFPSKGSRHKNREAVHVWSMPQVLYTHQLTPKGGPIILKVLRCIETWRQHHHLCCAFSAHLHPNMSPDRSTRPCWNPVLEAAAAPGRVSLGTSLPHLGGVSNQAQPWLLSCQVLPRTKKYSPTDSRDKENYHQEMKLFKLQMHVQKNH